MTNQIINYFKELDQKQGNKVHDTEKGIFGVSDLDIMKNFFEQIKPQENDVFIDLGSGDGRVNILAADYCESIGIEFDKELIEQSKTHKQQLNSQATFLAQDYETYDYSKATILFSFADHFFTPTFIEKLKEEFKGTLYVYEGVFLPEGIPKGKNIWVNQTKIVSYNFN